MIVSTKAPNGSFQSLYPAITTTTSTTPGVSRIASWTVFGRRRSVSLKHEVQTRRRQP